ncbi:MAG: ABC transporter ATP-binding protein [Melioribacteraceae bacterium]|nr:MAG: ABC transporter ATP-binding protein [Melioribacteraceae bacterium]
MNSAVKIENLSFSYVSNYVLENINLEIERNDFVGIIGPNGGGKTTLLKLIMGFIKPQKGSIKILETEPEKSISKIGYVPQFNQTDKQFPIKTIDVVSMGLSSSKSFFPWRKHNEIKNVYEAMEFVKISELAHKPFGELSGGQQQRCLIARALASCPEILILDEPTASVDSTVELDIYELLKKLNKDMTILLVSHDVGFISSYINKVACVNKEILLHRKEEISLDKISRDAYHGNFEILKHQCNL